MKKNWLRNTLVLSAIAGLLALVGCDTPADSDNGDWLVEEKNPFIGTWGYSSTNMTTGVVTNYELEFKTDSTIVSRTMSNGNTTTSTQYYLIKDNFIIISGSGSTVYTKYQFQALDNKNIKLTANGNPTNYTRVGAENPNADRTFNLPNGLEGYWRRDNLAFGQTEAASFMYDWYTFNKDGTYHVYHYMGHEKYYVDRGEFSYYIESYTEKDSNGDDIGKKRIVTINRLYDVTVYYDFTKNSDNAFSWATASSGAALGWERFDGETFWHAAE